jgi:hypothetical protein
MTSGDLIQWLVLVGVVGGCAAGVYIAWRALFKDRANGRRRCPRCWFDMAYSPGMTCGECGFTARHESQFAKTRRRYSVAILAMLTCAALVLYVNYQVSERGLVSMAPNKLLILAVPMVGSHTNTASAAVFDELSRRMAGQQLSEREWRMYIKRCAKGDWWARPISQEWIEKYGTEIHRLRRALVMREELTGAARMNLDAAASPYTDSERLLLDLPPLVVLGTQPTLPVDQSVRVLVQARHWWPSGSDMRIELVRRDDPAQRAVLVRSSLESWSSAVAELGFIDADTTQIMLDVHVQQRRSGLDEPWRSAMRETYTLQVQHDHAAAMTAIEDRLLDATLTEVFSSGVVAWVNSPGVVRFRFNPPATHVASFDDMAIGAAMELYRGDELARRLDLWWLAGTVTEQAILDRRGNALTPPTRAYGWHVVYEDEELLRLLVDEVSANEPHEHNWYYRVTGQHDIAQLVDGAETYWRGTLTLPVRLHLLAEDAPPPKWQHENDAEAP